MPEGKTYEDQFAFVILDDEDDVIGHLEVIRGYPAASEWWIGILLLAPAKRGRGWGAGLHRSCVKWARGQAANGLQLSIVEKNIDALRFWARVGYDDIQRKGPRRTGSKRHWLIVLRKAI